VSQSSLRACLLFLEVELMVVLLGDWTGISGCEVETSVSFRADIFVYMSAQERQSFFQPFFAYGETFDLLAGYCGRYLAVRGPLYVPPCLNTAAIRNRTYIEKKVISCS